MYRVANNSSLHIVRSGCWKKRGKFAESFGNVNKEEKSPECFLDTYEYHRDLYN